MGINTFKSIMKFLVIIIIKMTKKKIYHSVYIPLIFYLEVC